MFDLLPVPVMQLAGDGALLRVNDEFVSVFGYPREALATLEAWNTRAYPDRDYRARVHESWLAARRRLAEGARTEQFEVEITRGDGSRVTMLVTVRPAGDGFLLAFADVTERRRAESLAAGEKMMRVVMDRASDIVWVLDATERRFLYVSPAVERIRGFTVEEAMAQGAAAALAPASAEFMAREAPARVARFLEGVDVTYRDELEQLCKDGSTVWTEVSSRYATNEETGHVEVHGLTRDISGRRRIEPELRAREEQYRALTENMSEGLMRVDDDDRVLFVNERFCRMLGFAREELLGQIGHELYLFPEDWDLIDSMNARRKDGLADAYTVRMRRKNGEAIWVEISGSPVGPTGGLPSGSIGLITDVTRRHDAEEALKTSEARLRLVTDHAGDVVWEVDVEAKAFTYLSPSVEAMLGYAPAEMLGRRGFDVVRPESRERIARAMAERVPSLEAVPRIDEVEQVRRDGTVIWTEVKSSWARDEAGRWLLVGVTRDITERKRMEEELRRSEERHRLVAENSLDVVWTMAPDGRVTYVSPSIVHVRGLTPDEAMRQTLDEIHPPPSREISHSYFAKLLADLEAGRTPDNFHGELEYYTKDGSAKWFEVFAYPIFDASGAFVEILGVSRDISERRRAEDSLRAREEIFSTIVGQAVDAIALVEPETQRFVEFNEAAHRDLGYTREEFAGLRLEELQAERSPESVRRNIGQLLATGSIGLETTLRHRDGSERIVNVRAKKVTVRGRPYISAVWTDVTELRDALAALELERASLARKVEERTAELTRALRAKDEFLATMSHELRTPLNAILAISETLLEQIRGPLNERQQASLRIVESSGRHLLELITDILDLSKVEVGRLELQFEELPLASVCEASLQFVRETAAKKKLRVGFRLGDQLASVEADAKRLRQMLVNLLGNAVKFTGEGGQVTLEVGVDHGAELVRFAVKDTGVGISAENMPRLFQPFTQLDSSLSRQYEGTGLGLALVKRLAELHGGTIEVTSEPGRGSCFTIVLPRRQANRPVVRDARGDRVALAAPARSRRILLAEDNELNVAAIGDCLQDLGYEVVVAHDGRQAVDLAVETLPELVLMDVQMPGMDGLEAIGVLRKRQEFTRVPIVALTGLAMPGDRERCEAAGASAHLPKPVSLKEMTELMERLLAEVG